ncbi:FMN-binding protein [Leuconostoc falkenbergense]
MIKKITSAFMTIAVAFAVIIDGYIIFFKNNLNSDNLATSKQASSTSNSTRSSEANDSSKKALKDGTYTGKSTSTKWGDVQVVMIVSSGKITLINVVKHPTEGRSSQINENAIPIYKREVLAAQSSKINQVSGATETYKGFTGSLQDAITKAEDN